MRPLYSEAKDENIPWRQQGGHAGLWYDKFCNCWRKEPTSSEHEAYWTLDIQKGSDKESRKLGWIKTVSTPSVPQVGEEKLLKAASARMTQLLQHCDQTPLLYTTTYEFVTGLGREHPVENGFLWHHSLGVPYLPGSSVKGMVRAYAEQWTDEAHSEVEETLKCHADRVRCIFGPKDQEARQNAAVGSVIFLDALPTVPVQLKADIMTPHYGEYYAGQNDQNGEPIPPADYLSPNPIPFLVVQRGAEFQFGIMPRKNNAEGQADCEKVKGWLKLALEWTGAGAKTAVGYGRFQERDESSA